MRINAAVLWEQGKPLSVEPIEIDGPGPGEVLIEMRSAGVCHSDLHPARGDWPMKVPVVLGHEGAGIVREVGPNVTHVRVDDHVVLCWAPACGSCAACRDGRAVLCERLDKVTYRNRLPSGAEHLRSGDRKIAPFLGTACFADYVIVPEEGAIRVDPTIAFDALATLGCAVLTGVGAATTAARVPKGATVVVIGAGGVGLNVIQGARIAGAQQIIAVDLHERPLELARDFGATKTMNGNDPLPRGVDFVFDTVGSPRTLTSALDAIRKGGTVVLTGLSRADCQASFPMFPFVMQEKKLIGSVYGSGRPTEDIPRLASLFQRGELKLQELVARTYPLTKINEALDALASSDGARGVITW
ncbi:MAG TPA: Zn-dependent alcohol dehydrogenase [Vicinamibacterales bacterium]|nr:Zn-dependent alcohol dehydrogenase [Vicinamibacterales bacterium]